MLLNFFNLYIASEYIFASDFIIWFDLSGIEVVVHGIVNVCYPNVFRRHACMNICDMKKGSLFPTLVAFIPNSSRFFVVHVHVQRGIAIMEFLQAT
jgi:hypothetical protein